jgi:phosphatidate cytidylyltransferase
VCAAALLWLHSFFAAGVLSLIVVTGLAYLSLWELEHMGSLAGRKLGWMLGFVATLLSAALGTVLVRGDPIGPVVGLGALYLLAAVLSGPWSFGTILTFMYRGERSPRAREAVPLALWLLPPLFSIVLVDRRFGTMGLVVLIVLAKAGDNAGYFVGRAIGKRRPFPRISPGKTVAGCVASLVAGIVVGAVLLPLTLGERRPAQFALGAFLGGLVNLAAQAGDLSESWVKRRAGVKDSSTLLGPSGGVLDVIDSLLLAAPVALVAWSLAYGSEALPLP